MHQKKINFQWSHVGPRRPLESSLGCAHTVPTLRQHCAHILSTLCPGCARTVSTLCPQKQTLPTLRTTLCPRGVHTVPTRYPRFAYTSLQFCLSIHHRRSACSRSGAYITAVLLAHTLHPSKVCPRRRAMAQWFIFRDGCFMPMATWENYFFEEAIKQGHNVVSFFEVVAYIPRKLRGRLCA